MYRRSCLKKSTPNLTHFTKHNNFLVIKYRFFALNFLVIKYKFFALNLFHSRRCHTYPLASERLPNDESHGAACDSVCLEHSGELRNLSHECRS